MNTMRKSYEIVQTKATNQRTEEVNKMVRKTDHIQETMEANGNKGHIIGCTHM